MNNIQQLIFKIDEFIRKYYKNQLIRGSLYAVGIVAAFYLVAALTESVAQFDTNIRSIIFYTFTISFSTIVGYFIVVPLLKLYKLNKIISHEEAAKIIGKHFKNIDDKLINTLQLNSQFSSISDEQKLLLEASINQRISQLKPVPFTNAIDFSKNKKYAKYAAIPLAILLLILFVRPNAITEPTKRLVNHNQYYEKQAPFKFNIQNKSLKTIQNQDFKLDVLVSGDALPESVFLLVGDNEYKLSKNDKTNFTYLFKNVQRNTPFRFMADGFTSKEYTLDALPNPLVLNFDVQLNYPTYVGKKNETVHNVGDITVPIGTIATWTFNTKNTDALLFAFGDTNIAINNASTDRFQYRLPLFRNRTYIVKTANKYFKSADTIPYTITIIPDQYPTINVEEKIDSLSLKTHYFKGELKDDYGFSRLQFYYKKINAADSAGKPNVLPIAVTKQTTSDSFFYLWDLNRVNIQPGDEIEYYFEVWDNDGVHGAKSARTQKQIYKAPSLEELANNADKANAETKQDIQQAIKKAKDIQKELADLNKKLLDKKVLSYEEIKRLNELTKKQQDLAKKVDEIKNENQKQAAEQNEFNKPDEALLEKQKQLQDMFESIVPPEMKEKMKELEKLLQQLDKDKVQQALEQMKYDNKDMMKELDRTMEIFKQMEFEQKMTNTLDKLDKLANDEEKLADKANEKDSKTDNLKKEQQENDKKFDEVKKDLQDLEKQSKELSEDEQKMFDKEQEEKEESIDKDMKDSEQQLDQNQKSKAGKSQKSAAKKMKEMKDKMQAAMDGAENEQAEEDINALRDILENLIHISFEQEALIANINKTDASNPQYVKLTQDQKKLKDDAKMIEDSLLALSKRQPKVSSVINKEIGKINANMERTIAALAERQTPEAASRMQFVMTSENNLALMLSETLDQMQQQQAQSKPGSGKCSKPGGTGSGKGKPKQSAAQMKKMQEKINQQIEKLKKQLDSEKQANEKGGKKPGEKPGQKPGQKPGEQGGAGMFGNSKELAQTAAQQEALRRELQKMGDALNKDGKQGNGQLQKLAQEMEKTENDIVNRTITQETLKRQSEIMTRLLEAEKAEQERDQEERRKSNEAKTQQYTNPQNFKEYQLLKNREAELLKTMPPALTPYYKNKVNEYFNLVR